MAISRSLFFRQRSKPVIQNRMDFKLGVGLAVGCVFLLVYLIPNQIGPLQEADALMPTLTAGITLLLSLLLIMQAIRRPGESNHHAESRSSGQGSRWYTIALVVIIMAAFAWLLDVTGFVLTSLGAMVALFLVFGIRRWWLIAAISLGTLGGLYLCFDVMLGAPLPVGTLVETFLE